MQIKHFVNGEWVEVRQNKLAEAFDHAAAHGSAFESDLYKIATNNQGHVTQATPVTKTDLTNYGLLDTNAVAPVYSDNTTYSTGEFCIYQGKLYKALQDVDHEEFNPSKWEESNLLTATIGGGTVITGEADWNAQQGNLGYIKNKPDIPEGLPSVSAEDNGKTLVVDNGEWTIGSGGGGGTGGGVLVVHYVYDETLDIEVLDKTWQEIHDAPFAIVEAETPVGIFKCPVTVVTSHGDEYVILSARITETNVGEADVAVDKYIASSANGYPVFQD